MRLSLQLCVLPMLAIACSQPMSELRLAPRDLPRLEGPGQTGEARPGKASVAPAATELAATALPPVPAAVVSEAEVFGFIEQRVVAGQRAALAELAPGTTLRERLHYCLARIELDRAGSVVAELERLSRDHPDNAVIWRVLGAGYRRIGSFDAAIRAYRHCYELERKVGFKTCPTVTLVLGEAMLRSEPHRDAGIAFLREVLANGQEFVWAARRLAQVLPAQERFRDGLACLEAGLARDPQSPDLRYDKAVLLLHLYQLAPAIELLAGLTEDAKLGPLAREFLARGYFLAGDLPRALQCVEQLVAGKTPEGRSKDQYRELHEAVLAAQKDAGKRRFLAWELYAILRGHPSIKHRLKVLGLLARHQDAELATRALRIAANSESALLRVDALRRLLPRSTQPLSDLEAGFGDSDAKVRAMSADIAKLLVRKNPGDRSALITMVLEAMAREADAYAFASMHAALQSLTGVDLELPFGAAKDPTQRASLVKEWSKLR